MIQKSKRLDKVVRVFDPYQDRQEFIRLDRNEDPIGWDRDHFDNVIQSITPYDLAAYADSVNFVNKLAEWLTLSSENIYITSGSDQAIKNIFETYIDEGDKIIIQRPSWRMYDVYNDIYKGETVFIDYDKDFYLDTSKIINLIETENIRMVIIANPNQPIGGIIELNILRSVIETAKAHDTLVVIDEAYYLFSEISCIEFLQEFDNLIIVRTFSKAFGLASLRLGYSLSNSLIIKDLMLLRPVTDANGLALKIGEYALDNINWLTKKIKDYAAGRDFLYNEFSKHGLQTIQSYTNFIHILYPTLEKAQDILTQVKKKGYLIKVYNIPPLSNSIRISVGSKQLMQQFWSDCKGILCSN